MMKIFYKSETEKAISSFGNEKTPQVLVRAYGEVKKAALLAQQQCYQLYDETLFKHMMETLDEIIEGKHCDQFPLPLEQGGAGTSLHMNINEVICGLTLDKSSDKSILLDPLEDMAKYQSTNDTFSTALSIMVYRQILSCESSVIQLQEILVKKELEFENILMTGRTELQDALPIKMGQIFGAWAGSIERDRWRLHKLKERLRNIALGGTAMGTCFSAPRKYVFKAEKNLREITGLPLCRSQNLVDQISNHDTFVEVASGFKQVALNLRKISNDLLLYTSSLSGEMKLKELQYGSTIMPFKTNPVLLEYIKGLSISIKYECLKIEDYASEGQLQLNPFLPFMAQSFILVNEKLLKSLNALSQKLLPGLECNEEKIKENLYKSPALINTLKPLLGYEKLKQIVPLIQSKNPQNMDQIIEIIEQNSSLSLKELKEWFEPSNLTSNKEYPMGEQ